MRFNLNYSTHIFIFASLLWVLKISAQINHRFEHIELPIEISDSKANSILEDSKGYIWFGFSNGLVFYDGYKGSIVNCVIENKDVQSFGDVRSLIQDIYDRIWVGTSNGVFIYDPIKETSINLDDSKFNGIVCRSLDMTSKGEILIGTEEGLLIYSPQGVFLEQYVHQQGIKSGLSHNIVRCSYEDKKGNIWIGTYDKLNLLDRKEKKINRFKLQLRDSLFHSNNLILRIAPLDKENDSILLVGTETGLCLFNTHTYNFTQYSHKENENSISNSVVKSISKVDNQIWLGTDLGLNLFDYKEQNLTNYYYDFNNSFSISNNVINDLYLDGHRNLWIATDVGIDKVYLNSNNILLNQFDKNSSFFKEGVIINGFSRDYQGNIWVATQQGVFKFDRKNNSFNQFLPPKILHNKVVDIYCDQNDLIWIATSGGLNIYDSKSKNFLNYVSKLTGGNVLTSNYLTTISQDSRGTVWIGTFNKGLFKVSNKGNGDLEFINFKYEFENENSLSSNSINDITFDAQDNVWIATDKGINCFYQTNGIFERFNDENVFGTPPTQSVFQLYFDEENVLWASSYSGLYQWNPRLEKFKHFTNFPYNVTSVATVDSLVYFTADNKFFYFNKKKQEIIRIPNYEIGLRDIINVELISDQTMLLTGSTGFASLSFDDLKHKENTPQLKWTGFAIGDVEIKPYLDYNSRRIIDRNIDNIDKISLEYEENSFRVEFSSFPFNSNEAVGYKYMLEDYDSEWQISKYGQNYASYTQVRPGKYKLKVRASNSQGLYIGAERVLHIVIKPPMHLSWWALTIYMVLFILLILFYRRILINRERDKSELKFEKKEHQRSEELIELKTRFFTNITHELKTPLTLISSPVDELLTKQLDKSTIKRLSLVKRNTDRLKKLVNQILDIRKIEAGGEKLRIQKYDIVKFCNQVKNQFKDESIKRNIFLQFSSEPQSLIIWFDLEKVEKILMNLLSNAFKFTHDKGTIRVSISAGDADKEENSNYVFITVSDTGKGISKEDQIHMFDRFNSLSSPNYTKQKGTGIGLSIIYEYTAMHNGVVKFDSIQDMGSKFTFSLPTNKSLLQNYDILDKITKDKQEVFVEIEEGIVEDEKIHNDHIEEPISLKALVVEDDTDMREFLTDGLSAYYKVIEAEDGQVGYRKAIKHLPDIIVSDLMMPNVDGIEFCKKIKGDFRTSHIPFILLTAKGDLTSEISGIETGADDYIRKPFNLEHVTTRMKTLIKQRESLRRIYQQQMKLEPSNITVNSIDERFLDDLLSKIEMEIDNSELSVKLLSNMLGISSTNLYRKIKALTGQTATEFIRNIRLKRAAQLLKNEYLNVSEVMYMVGFTHRSYFTRCFREMYGVSPKSYGK